MSEIRNLTRNGETFYPLTTSSAVINESTGEGLIIDNEPTVGSNNLVKSGGVAADIFNIDFENKQSEFSHRDYPMNLYNGIEAIDGYFSGYDIITNSSYFVSEYFEVEPIITNLTLVVLYTINH